MKYLFISALLLTSCATDKKPDKKEDSDTLKGPEKRIVGRIASVSQADEFVLIQRLGNGNLPNNVVYQSKGPEGRSASLRLSGERVLNFYAADLVSGTVETGDAVVAYTSLEKKKGIGDEAEDFEGELTDETNGGTENEKSSQSDQDLETIKDSH